VLVATLFDYLPDEQALAGCLDSFSSMTLAQAIELLKLVKHLLVAVLCDSRSGERCAWGTGASGRHACAAALESGSERRAVVDQGQSGSERRGSDRQM